MDHRTLTSTLIAGILVASTFAAQAGNIYRWVDGSGNTVVSDRPPPAGTEFEVMSTSTGRVIEEPPEIEEQGASAGIEIEYVPGTPPPGSKAPPPDPVGFPPDKNPELCKQARDTKLTLDTRPRIRFIDESGEPRFMTDEERQVEKDKAAAAIDAYCEN